MAFLSSKRHESAFCLWTDNDTHLGNAHIKYSNTVKLKIFRENTKSTYQKIEIPATAEQENYIKLHITNLKSKFKTKSQIK